MKHQTQYQFPNIKHQGRGGGVKVQMQVPPFSKEVKQIQSPLPNEAITPLWQKPENDYAMTEHEVCSEYYAQNITRPILSGMTTSRGGGGGGGCNRVCIWMFLGRYIMTGCIFCAPSALWQGQVLNPQRHHLSASTSRGIHSTSRGIHLRSRVPPPPPPPPPRGGAVFPVI